MYDKNQVLNLNFSANFIANLSFDFQGDVKLSKLAFKFQESSNFNLSVQARILSNFKLLWKSKAQGWFELIAAFKSASFCVSKLWHSHYCRWNMKVHKPIITRFPYKGSNGNIFSMHKFPAHIYRINPGSLNYTTLIWLQMFLQSAKVTTFVGSSFHNPWFF